MKNWIHNRLILAITFLIIHSGLIAQPDYLNKEYIQVKDGLSDNRVSNIYQDKKGFLWIGTQKGVNKYDGYSFTKYYSKPLDDSSLTDNDISCIKEDINGNIWIGTYTKGINRLNPKMNKVSRFMQSTFDKNSLVNNTVWDIAADSLGNIWIATDNGISKYNLGKNTFTNYSIKDTNENISGKNLSLQNIYAITVDNKGNLWFGGHCNELHKYDSENDRFLRYSIGLESLVISDMYCDSDGIIWIGSNDGFLSWFNTDSLTYHQLTDQDGHIKRISYQVWTITEDKKGNLWIGSFGSLALVNKKSLEVKYYDEHLSDASRFDKVQTEAFSAILQDESGVIWIASRTGLMKLTERIYNHYKHSEGINSISSNFVTSFAQDSAGIIWIGTDNGLNSFNPLTKEFRQFFNHGNKKNPAFFVNNNNINSLLIDNNNDLWLGSEGYSLTKFNISNQTFTNIGHQHTSANLTFQIFDDQEGYIWTLSSSNLISKYNKENYECQKVELPDYIYALSMEKDKHGNFWFGTFHNKGLFRYNQKTNEWKKFSYNEFDTNSLCKGTIYDIWEESDSSMWVATDNGLNNILYNADKDSYAFRRFDNIYPNNTVFAIADDRRGLLWLRLMQGLSIFNPETKIFKNYSGMVPISTGDEWKMFKAKDNRIFLAGTNGFIIFNSDVKNDYMPPIVLTHFYVNEKKRSELIYNDRIELDWDENSISCEFAALDYTNPNLNHYKYWLEGVDKDWIFSGTRRYINYTNLEPGEYCLHLKGSNSDGKWNEAGLSIPIHISPPFWETTWYYLAEILFFGSLLTITIFINRKSKMKNIAGLSIMTILTLLVIFEFVNVTVEPYVEGIAGGVPVFKLLLNLMIAVLFFPLEKLFFRLMKNKKSSLNKDNIIISILKEDIDK